MRQLLEGQVALVTGGSSGIGLGVVEAMAAAGARVGINYVGGERAAQEAADRIRAGGGEAMPVQADVSKEADVERMFDAVIAAYGAIDILVANAGIQIDAAITEMSLRDWQRVLDVNLTGQFLCCRRAIAEFRRRGPRPEVSKALGKILCMSSVHQLIPWAGHVNYAASKGGVMVMMQSLAQEVAHERIRVNAIAPGAIRTPINRGAWETGAALEKLLTLIPYGRIGEPEDIAKAAVWLCSDEADYITGASLFVDGGMSLFPGFRDNG